MKYVTQIPFVLIAASCVIIGCSNGGGSSASDSGSTALGSLQANPNLNPVLKVSLTDAPNKDLKAVVVNVAQIEIFLKKGSTEKRLIVGQNLGAVDLLQLQNGVLLPIANGEIPSGVEVREIRLVLNNDQNYAVEKNNTICPMQTPSGQQSGVKIKLGQSFTLEAGHEYSLVVDFDAKKSVVVKGNGGCLLKPVIKIPMITKRVIVTEPVDPETGGTDDSDTNNPPVPVTDGSDTNNSDPNSPYLDGNGVPLPPDQLGFDPHDPSTYPPGVTFEDLYMYF